jgi:hypothetical protein
MFIYKLGFRQFQSRGDRMNDDIVGYESLRMFWSDVYIQNCLDALE